MAIDDLIDRLAAALRARGVPPPDAPTDLSGLDDIDEAIAPLRLPTDLRELHERIDVTTLRMRMFPDPSSPAFSLRSWQRDRKRPGLYPMALFQIGYENHRHLSIELDGPEDRNGGAIVYQSDDAFEIAHLSLREWFEGWVAAAEAPTSRYEDLPNGPYLETLTTERPPWRPLWASSPHPVYGTAVADRTLFKIPAFVVPQLLWEWPERWRRLGGIDEELARPRGVTSTIADLREAALAAPGETIMATIAGEVRYLSGGSDHHRLRVRDATGAINVWCPTAASLFFDGGGGSEWELSVGLRWDEARQQLLDDQERLSMSGDPDERMQALFFEKNGFTPEIAYAGAIRPLWRYK